ncbi:penicillin-binding protein 2 [Sulfurovum sp.]|uniref:peptidoglycan D,D-transpeptidase FtsI family protein n=1 Tax=Sulfurovum sp. TaxID=1969726 RepID=UPI0025EBF4DE|nr:penicillin-binding protein 2 [Sulfurovum sp.]
MNRKIQNQAIHQRKYKITGLFLILIIAMAIFLSSVLKTIASERNIPSHNTTIYDRSFRGSIISADEYTLSNSQKTYQAVIRGASIDPDKKELFIKLFSIYSGIGQKELRKKFKDRKGREIKGNIILSKSITSRHAMQLRSLAYKLRKLGVFRSIKNRNGIEVLYGLDIIENGETRRFPLKDVMSPILGYVGKKSDGRYTRPEGKKGLERKYEKHITSKKNGYFKGKRDVIGAVIHDKNSIKMQRVDGLDLHLNIPLAFQRRVELMLDSMKRSIDADEIIVGVMESKTGKVLSLASSERYDPSHITQKDIPALNPKFSEYPYEAGSVIKPITLAIALDHKVVTPNSWFKTYNGRFQIGKRRWITDDEKFDSLDATDIIVHSSNIGISQISWRLTGKEFRDGLLKFGIAKPSGIDLSRDLPGQLKPLYLLDNKMHRANSSYGYGMMVTFAQLFKAYSAFNNDGVAVTPRIVNYLQDAKGRHYTLEPKVGNLKAVGKKAARQIHNILLEVVKRGTGVKAQYPGLEVGGKTGTAHIAKHGRYVREYHSSFYGFANDKKGHKYTIGVLVVRAKKRYKYFASQSAVPTFRRIIDILVELDYLEPEGGIEVVSPEIKVPSASSVSTAVQKSRKTKPSARKKVNIRSRKNEAKKEKKRNTKKKSVKSLFKIETQPKPKTNVKPRPAKNKSPHEMFDDLF